MSNEQVAATSAGVNMMDVLMVSYMSAKPPVPQTKDNTALLLIDIQHLAEPSHLAQKAIAAGLDEAAVFVALEDYSARFNAALANCQKILNAAREFGIVPIHIKIQSLSKTARDTGALHRRMGWTFAPGDAATAFLDPTKPLHDEIVITKTASGAFTGTALETTLKNMGIEYMVICGFVTDECVETTARTALDLGFVVKIIEDGTTTYFAESYLAAIGKFASLGFTIATDAAIDLFSTLN